MERNDDYKNGIRFLLQKCKERGVNVRKVEWVPIFSRFLSERDACYKFWYNVDSQNKLERIEKCVFLRDIIFNIDTFLFSWHDTKEGALWWQDILLKETASSFKFSTLKELTSF